MEKLGFKNQKPKILNFEYINQVLKIVNQKLQMTKPKTKNQKPIFFNFECRIQTCECGHLHAQLQCPLQTNMHQT
jgi:hypothetical protein